MLQDTNKFDKLISKRNRLLDKNLDKELQLAKDNLKKQVRKEIKEEKVKKINTKKLKEIPKQKVKLTKKKMLKKPETKKVKSVVKKQVATSKHLSMIKFFKRKKPSKINLVKKKEMVKKNLPNKKILKKERAIDLAVSKEKPKKQILTEKEILNKKSQKKIKEEKLRKIIIKNSEKQSSKISSEVKEIAVYISQLKKEMAKVVIGQERIINAFICALLCDGHVLLEGVPGIAKTLIIKTLAKASGCSSKRIQFTVDLLPSDILGITTYTPQKGFETIKGPIFANFVVADEINRSPPKTQSAMIEAMQEKQVTIGKETFKLPYPFFVMANNNPLEVSGVYTLPEAQIDRFLFKLLIHYPKNDEEKTIMQENMTLKKFEDFNIKAILSPEKIMYMQKITKEIYVDDKIKEYIIRIVDKTRKRDFPHGQYIEWGGSPRASIGLFIASKAWALLNGRNYVVPKDVKDIAHFVLRHRIILNYRAKAEKLTSDKVIDEILDMIEV